jgi:hypothetical protein
MNFTFPPIAKSGGAPVSDSKTNDGKGNCNGKSRSLRDDKQRTSNGKNKQTQIPYGDDKQKGQATATASATQRNATTAGG